MTDEDTKKEWEAQGLKCKVLNTKSFIFCTLILKSLAISKCILINEK